MRPTRRRTADTAKFRFRSLRSTVQQRRSGEEERAEPSRSGSKTVGEGAKKRPRRAVARVGRELLIELVADPVSADRAEPGHSLEAITMA